MKNTFLNDDLEEKVCMEPPPEFNDLFGQHVCKLKKSLLWTETISRAWFERFTKFMRSQDYHQGQSDRTLFTKRSNTRNISVLIVYVDDIILICDDIEEINRLMKSLEKEC